MILGVIVGFIFFLASKESERKEKDAVNKSKACAPGTYISTFYSSDKEYIVCKMPDNQYWNEHYFVRKYGDSL